MNPENKIKLINMWKAIPVLSAVDVPWIFGCAKDACTSIYREIFGRFPYSKESRDLYSSLFPTSKAMFRRRLDDSQHYGPVNAEGFRSIKLFFEVTAKSFFENVELFKQFRDHGRSFVWSEKQLQWLKNASPIVVEHGWLPRDSYQISSTGSNFRSSIASESSEGFLEIIPEDQVRLICSRIRRIYRVEPGDGPESAFLVVPLQTGTDLNLRYSETPFARFYSPVDPESTGRFGQALIDHLSEMDPPLPMIFTQHPADHSKAVYAVRRKEDRFVDRDSSVSTGSLLNAPNCRGIVSVNSNVVHQAVVLGLPCCVLGRMLWKKGDSPFPSKFEDFVPAKPNFDSHSRRTLSYLAKLFASQWFLNDFQNPGILARILEDPDCCPYLIRKELGYFE